ncbi:MAG: SurA N-terminal domain-containing protein [Deltaproteobacteria bacterium]|nr:SurA N-terminal domain-containing protein [Deltaproteobacteria bacterium]
MLSVVRRQAASWIVKVIFGLIILSFMFFFGYTSLSSRNDSNLGTNVVALVNGEPITQTQLELAYNAQRERFKKEGSSEIPKQLQDFLRQNILTDLIRQKLMSQLATNLKLTTSDKEISEEIFKMPVLWREGRFDENFYKETFRPYYLRKFGVDFEQELRDEKLRMKLIDSVKAKVEPTDLEVWNDYLLKKTEYEFQKVVTDDRTKAETLLGEWKSGKNIKSEKLPLTSFANLKQQLGPEIEDEQIVALISLTQEKPFLDKPISTPTNKFILFRLMKKVAATPAGYEKEKESIRQSLASERAQEVLVLLLSRYSSLAAIKKSM